MAVQKSLFAALKHIVPGDMEYYLEERNSEGLKLLPLAQSSLFFFQFSEEPPEKYKYVVDKTAMPKVQYMRKLTEEGWEYLGSSFNCYVWRKKYEEGQRPEDFSDTLGVRTHCLRLGIVMAVLALAFLGLFCALIYALLREYRAIGMNGVRMATYLLIIALHIPFIYCFAVTALKLLRALPQLSRKVQLKAIKRRAEAARDEDTQEDGEDFSLKEAESASAEEPGEEAREESQ